MGDVIVLGIIKLTKPFFVANSQGPRTMPTMASEDVPATVSYYPGDEIFEFSTIEDATNAFIQKGYTLVEDDWLFPERTIRLVVPNEIITAILKEYPELVSKVSVLKDYIISKNGYQIIYLEEISDADRMLFANYIQYK